MEIEFTYGGIPVGGRITNYLLEKVQLKSNFHLSCDAVSSGE